MRCHVLFVAMRVFGCRYQEDMFDLNERAGLTLMPEAAKELLRQSMEGELSI